MLMCCYFNLGVDCEIGLSKHAFFNLGRCGKIENKISILQQAALLHEHNPKII